MFILFEINWLDKRNVSTDIGFMWKSKHLLIVANTICYYGLLI